MKEKKTQGTPVQFVGQLVAFLFVRSLIIKHTPKKKKKQKKKERKKRKKKKEKFKE